MPEQELPIIDYIGDGVYAVFAGYDIELKTQRIGGENVIYLNPEVLASLLKFAVRCGFVIPKEGQ